ncbi:MAG: ATP-binding protein [Pseudomonadota bacterium]
MEVQTNLPTITSIEQVAGPQVARLLSAITDLSLARDLDTVMRIVRTAARELTGADGATFVLRDGDQCHYADEDAIEPLWKGLKFPMSACISGWAMLNQQAAVIEDIYADSRIPADAYRPTFVKSLVMVPIRIAEPIGAIGNYWAVKCQPKSEDVALLQALADSASIAIENVQLVRSLEQRVKQRTAELEAANKELEAFSYAVSHDLRAPLRAIDGFSAALAEEARDQLNGESLSYIKRVRGGVEQMRLLIEDLLRLSQTTRVPLRLAPLDITRLVNVIIEERKANYVGREIKVDVAKDMFARAADQGLVRVLFENLIDNAIKFTGQREIAVISVSAESVDGETVFSVRDNGAGFDANYKHRLFGAFQRLHSSSEFEGTGIGLATTQRIVNRHGGRIWAEAAIGQGAEFFFTLE